MLGLGKTAPMMMDNTKYTEFSNRLSCLGGKIIWRKLEIRKSKEKGERLRRWGWRFWAALSIKSAYDKGGSVGPYCRKPQTVQKLSVLDGSIYQHYHVPMNPA